MNENKPKFFKFFFWLILGLLIILFQLNFLNQTVGLRYLNLILTSLIILNFLKIKKCWLYFLLTGLILDLLLPLPFLCLTLYFLIIYLINVFLSKQVIVSNQWTTMILLLIVDLVVYYLYLWGFLNLLNLLGQIDYMFKFEIILFKDLIKQILITGGFMSLVYLLFKNKINQLHEGNKPFYSTIR